MRRRRSFTSPKPFEAPAPSLPSQANSIPPKPIRSYQQGVAAMEGPADRRTASENDVELLQKSGHGPLRLGYHNDLRGGKPKPVMTEWTNG